MKRWFVPALVAAVVLALGVFAAVSSKEDSGDSDDTKNASSHGRKNPDDRGGRVKADNEDKGHGPPSWAHSKRGKLGKAAREEWKELSPQERRTLMDELIREHVEGMKEWRDCVLAERDDCEMPFPPGLARLR